MWGRRRSAIPESRAAQPLAACVAAVAFSACAPAAPQPPSLLLIVVDTLRADAVSCYGDVADTTPEIDALAREGLRYERAYAPAPWTLPSHATIFSGLGAEEHRVGMPGQGRLPEEVVTLAERLRSAGYQTAAFSENSVVSDPFQLLQGFDERRFSALRTDGSFEEIDASAEVDRWLARGDPGTPFFVFVNLLGPHQPYEIREENPFVPPGTPRSQLLQRSSRPNRLICGGLPGAHEIDVLHGLYLGDVHDADARLGRIVRALRERAGGSLITIVTSDHGEYFGEGRLLGHEFGLHEAVLRVPLVVHGLGQTDPAVIPEPVGLVDIAPSLLAWAGLELPSGLAGRPLPRGPGVAPGDRELVAFYSDATHWIPEEWQRSSDPFDLDESRQFCSESDRVWGGMAAILRPPEKFVWYERYPPALYDLRWDPLERSNQAPHNPQEVERFLARLAPRLRQADLAREGPGAASPFDPEAEKALRELGYIE